MGRVCPGEDKFRQKGAATALTCKAVVLINLEDATSLHDGCGSDVTFPSDVHEKVYRRAIGFDHRRGKRLQRMGLKATKTGLGCMCQS
jgi:hypothetical protein